MTSNATLTINLCRILRRDHDFQLLPQETQALSDRMIIETYPALVKEGHRKEGHAIPEMHALIGEHMKAKPGSDRYDAAVCALLAVAFGAEGRFNDWQLIGPPADHAEIAQREGWIYSLESQAR